MVYFSFVTSLISIATINVKNISLHYEHFFRGRSSGVRKHTNTSSPLPLPKDIVSCGTIGLSRNPLREENKVNF